MLVGEEMERMMKKKRGIGGGEVEERQVGRGMGDRMNLVGLERSSQK